MEADGSLAVSSPATNLVGGSRELATLAEVGSEPLGDLDRVADNELTGGVLEDVDVVPASRNRRKGGQRAWGRQRQRRAGWRFGRWDRGAVAEDHGRAAAAGRERRRAGRARWAGGLS